MGLAFFRVSDRMVVCVLALLDAIQVTSRQERELEAELIERPEVHADQHIFTSLPRAGHGVRAAALLADRRDRHRRSQSDHRHLQLRRPVHCPTRRGGELLVPDLL
jgi:hypothetical protein